MHFQAGLQSFPNLTIAVYTSTDCSISHKIKSGIIILNVHVHGEVAKSKSLIMYWMDATLKN